MDLNLSAAFQPDADLVYVNFSSTDNQNLVVADAVTFNLYQQTSNLIGTLNNSLLTSFSVTNQYSRPEKDYEVTFLHPPSRMDLWVEVQATFSGTVLTKMVQVGVSDSPQQTMVLPDNNIWEFDPFEVIPTQGGSDDIPNDNIIIAAPEIQNYVEKFDFSTATETDILNLSYAGGGNRLLLQNQTNQFVLQAQDQAPWTIPAYLFLEDNTENLLPNTFFINNTAQNNIQTPNGWSIKSGYAAVWSSVAFDHTTSSDAMIWSVRFLQNENYYLTNEVGVSLVDLVSVQENTSYVFSSYIMAQQMSMTTTVNTFTCNVVWYDVNQQIISIIGQDFNFSNFSGLNLAQVSAISPVGAVFASIEINMTSNGGNDLQLKILGPQLEQGNHATSRVQGSRNQDLVTIPLVDTASAKLRLGMIMGFDSSSVLSSTEITSGDIIVSMEPGNLVKVNITGIGFCQVPLTFSVGDYVDLTIQCAESQNLSIYLSGQLQGSTALPSFPSNPVPLTLVGKGFELLTLSVFSRS
jgi:hypothetical protein